MRHPNIVRLFSHFGDDNFCYFVMEYLPGGDLHKIQKIRKKFEANQVALLMCHLISVVYILHKMDSMIIHRNIKPANTVLQMDGN